MYFKIFKRLNYYTFTNQSLIEAMLILGFKSYANSYYGCHGIYALTNFFRDKFYEKDFVEVSTCFYDLYKL